MEPTIDLESEFESLIFGDSPSVADPTKPTPEVENQLLEAEFYELMFGNPEMQQIPGTDGDPSVLDVLRHDVATDSIDPKNLGLAAVSGAVQMVGDTTRGGLIQAQAIIDGPKPGAPEQARMRSIANAQGGSYLSTPRFGAEVVTLADRYKGTIEKMKKRRDALPKIRVQTQPEQEHPGFSEVGPERVEVQPYQRKDREPKTTLIDPFAVSRDSLNRVIDGLENPQDLTPERVNKPLMNYAVAIQVVTDDLVKRIGYAPSQGIVSGTLEGAAQSAPHFAAGITLSAGATAIGGPGAGAIVGGAYFGTTEGFTHTADVYDGLIEKGMGDQEARLAASNSGLIYGTVSSVLEGFGVNRIFKGTRLDNAIKHAIAKPGVAQKLKNAAGAGVVEGLTEVAQGVVSEALTAEALDDWDGFKTKYTKSDEPLKEFAAAFLLGGGTRLGIDVVSPEPYKSLDAWKAANGVRSSDQTQDQITQGQGEGQQQGNPDQGLVDLNTQPLGDQAPNAEEGNGAQRENDLVVEQVAPGQQLPADQSANDQQQNQQDDPSSVSVSPASEVVRVQGESPANGPAIQRFQEANRAKGVRVVEPQTPAHRRAVSFFNERGVPIQLVEVDTDGDIVAPAMWTGDGVVIAANAGPDEYIRSLVYHEAFHELKRRSPEAWQRVYEIIEKIDPQGLANAEQRYFGFARAQGVTVDTSEDARADEAVSTYAEGVAAWIESARENPEQMRRIIEQNPRAWAKVLDAIQRALNKLGLRSGLTISQRAKASRDAATIALEMVQALDALVGAEALNKVAEAPAPAPAPAPVRKPAAPQKQAAAVAEVERVKPVSGAPATETSPGPAPEKPSVPELEKSPAGNKLSGSWVIVDRETGEAVAELSGKSAVEKVNQERYEVLTANQWLTRLNEKPEPGPAPQRATRAPARGRAAVIRTPNRSTPIEAEYQIVEANDLIPSHDARRGFQKNPGGDLNERPYDDPTAGKNLRENVRNIAGDIKPDLLLTDTPTPADGPPIVNSGLVVLGGNARTMSIQVAYGAGNANGLREQTIEAAERFGFNRAEVEAFENPVLVRTVSDKDAGAPGELSRELNANLTAARRPDADAVSRGSKIDIGAAREISAIVDDGTLSDVFNDQTRTARLSRTLVGTGALEQTDLDEWMDDRGLFTQEGRRKIEMALLGSVVSDVRTLAETSPSMRQSLIRSLPHLMSLNSTGIDGADFRPVLANALSMMSDLKKSDARSLDDLRSQVSILPQAWRDDPQAQLLAARMDDQTPTQLAKRLGVLAEGGRDQASGQVGMFGAGPEAAFDDALDPELRFAIAPPVESRAFRKWFGDSKIVDADGNPLVMYHGTVRAGHSVFKPLATRPNAPMFFTKSTGLANSFTLGAGEKNSAVYPVYIKAENIFDYKNPEHTDALYRELANSSEGLLPRRLRRGEWENLLGGDWEALELPEVQDAITRMGHDGFWAKEADVETLGIYRPEQVKSINNAGSFDSNNPDIRFAIAPPENSRALRRWYGNAKPVDANGDPLKVYHGTGNAGMTVVDRSFFGQGNDQFGPGFYTTSDTREGGGYTTRRIDPDSPKLGGEGAPGVLPLYIRLENPLEINADETRHLDDALELSPEQAFEVIRRSPIATDPDGPLADWIDGDGVTPFDESDLRSIAAQYSSPMHIAGDIFRNENMGEFLDGLAEATGYDGVIVTFPANKYGPEKKHVIAWKPEQVKSVNNTGEFNPENPDIRFALFDQNDESQSSRGTPKLFSSSSSSVRALPKSHGLKSRADTQPSRDDQTSNPLRADRVGEPSASRMRFVPKFEVGTSSPSEPTRTVFNATDDIGDLMKVFPETKRIIQNTLEEVTRSVEGTRLAGVRENPKDQARMRQKRREGKPVETQGDLAGARIATDNMNAARAIVAEIQRAFRVLEVDDSLLDGEPRPGNGYSAVHLTVATDTGMAAEIQVHSTPLLEQIDVTHKLYDQTKELDKEGDAAEIAEINARIAEINYRAMAKWGEASGPSPQSDDLGVFGQRMFRSNTGSQGGLFDRVMGDGESQVAREAREKKERDEKRIGTEPNQMSMFAIAAPVESREFRRWFGNSKVVDAEGNPLVMYHGTPTPDFGEFKTSRRNVFSKNTQPIFLTAIPSFTDNFAMKNRGTTRGLGRPAVLPVYVSAEKPFYYANDDHIRDLENYLMQLVETDQTPYSATTIKDRVRSVRQGFWEYLETDLVMDAIRAMGYDGVYVEEEGVTNLGVFRSEQIKSAIGNNGAFDPENPDIRFSLAPPVETREFRRWFGNSKVKDNDGPLVVYHGTEAPGFTVFDPTKNETRTRGGIFFSAQRSTAKTYAIDDRDIKIPFAEDAEEVRVHAGRNYVELWYDAEDTGWGARKIWNDKTESPAESQEEALEIMREQNPGFEIGPDDLRVVYQLYSNIGGDILSETDNEEDLVHDFNANAGEIVDPNGAIYPVFLRIENPYEVDAEGNNWNDIYGSGEGYGTTTNDLVEEARMSGADGLIIRNVVDEGPHGAGYELEGDVYVVFSPNQIKSATDNTGAFDPDNPDIRFALAADPIEELEQLLEDARKKKAGVESLIAPFVDAGRAFIADKFVGRDGLKYITARLVSKETGPARAKYPWRVTEFTKRGDENWTPWGHTLHKTRDEAISEAASTVKAEDVEEVRFALGWHGTPHIFERFTTAKIGTGEGAQAYGWGMYFASKREVAEWYRSNLSKAGRYTDSNAEWADIEINGESLATKTTIPPDLEFMQYVRTQDKPGMVRHADWKARRWEELAADESYEFQDYAAKQRDQWTQMLADIESGDVKHRGRGALYKVNLAPREDEYLLWDEPMTEQSERVRDLLGMPAPRDMDAEQRIIDLARERGVEPHETPEYKEWDDATTLYNAFRYKTGSVFYRQLADSKSPEWASKNLFLKGVRGVKYKDGTSRNRGGAGVDSALLAAARSFQEDGQTRDKAFEGMQAAYPEDSDADILAAISEAYTPETYNYVIFDENDVEIQERFAIQNPDPKNPTPLPLIDRLPDPPAKSRGWRRFFEPNDTTGMFNGINPNPRTGFSLMLDHFRRSVQDKFLPVFRVQQGVEAAGGRVSEEANVYRAETLYYGKAQEAKRRFDKFIVEPLLEKMHKAGIERGELDLYLYAKHAPERNRVIAERNPDFKGPGSGMTDAEAAEIVDRIESGDNAKAFAELLEEVRKLREWNLNWMVENDLVSQAQADAWRKMYDHYVPLRTADVGDAPMPRRPQGFSVQGPESKKAKGRSSLADSPLLFLIHQGDAAIVRAERNRVGLAMMQLILDNPDQTLWDVYKPTVTTSGPVDLFGGYETSQVPTTGISRIKNDPKTVTVKYKGEERYLFLHNEDLARALKNIGTANLPKALKLLQYYMRFKSAMVTSFNPEFVLTNFVRDIQTAAVNISADDSAKAARRVVKNTGKAVRGAWRATRETRKAGDETGGGKWAQLYREFVEDGGKTGWTGAYSFDERAREIAQLARKVKNGQNQVIRAASGLINLIGDANTAVENGVRLAYYAELREQGVDRGKAAEAAKNLTVNFNRKGEHGTMLNTLYLFFNASVQGNVRMLQALNTRTGRKIMAGVTAAAFGLAYLNAFLSDEDDDGELFYDKLSDWEKSHNLILMLPGSGGRYIKLPLPYGYNVFHSVGTNLANASRGEQTSGQAISSMAESALNSFNPIGGSDIRLATMVPEVGKPFAELETNQNFLGREINPMRFPGDTTPDSHLFFGSDRGLSGAVAQEINRLTGGDEVRPGLIDLHPGTIEHLWDAHVGGAGRFVRQLIELPGAAMSDGDFTLRQTPVVRRFAGEPFDGRHRSQFWRNTEQMRELRSFEKGYMDTGDSSRLAAYREESGPMLEAAWAFDLYERVSDDLRSRAAEGDATVTDERLNALYAEANRLARMAERGDEVERPVLESERGYRRALAEQRRMRVRRERDAQAGD